MRNFNEWLSCFKNSISDYGYYTDFEKVHCNIDKIKVELNILNSLIGVENIGQELDFVIIKTSCIYGIETNFYGNSGSKLNETARSYKTLSLESKKINGFFFVWSTDGKGWQSARHNLEETFDIMEHIYNIDDMENGIMNRIFILQINLRSCKMEKSKSQ